jgi:hypothetical protein
VGVAESDKRIGLLQSGKEDREKNKEKIKTMH